MTIIKFTSYITIIFIIISLSSMSSLPSFNLLTVVIILPMSFYHQLQIVISSINFIITITKKLNLYFSKVHLSYKCPAKNATNCKLPLRSTAMAKYISKYSITYFCLNPLKNYNVINVKT